MSLTVNSGRYSLITRRRCWKDTMQNVKNKRTSDQDSQHSIRSFSQLQRSQQTKPRPHQLQTVSKIKRYLIVYNQTISYIPDNGTCHIPPIHLCQVFLYLLSNHHHFLFNIAINMYLLLLLHLPFRQCIQRIITTILYHLISGFRNKQDVLLLKP